MKIMKPKYILMIMIIIICSVAMIMTIFYGEGRIKPLYLPIFVVLCPAIATLCVQNLIRNRKDLFRKK